MSKYKINNQKEFISLAKLIKPNKSYNVSVQEAKVRETGFTDRQLEQLAGLLAPINKRLDKIETRLDKIEERLERIENTPTMQKELKTSK